MDFQIYQRQAMRSAKPMTVEDDLMHAAFGLSGEAGEFADAIKKHLVYSKPLDRENAAEELGDILWYVALGCHALGVSMVDVAQANIEKLKKRYPEKFTDELASARLDKVTDIAAAFKVDASEAVAAIEKVRSELNDGWIEWTGGTCPVDPQSPVHVWLRGGTVSRYAVSARTYWWGYSGGSADIVAYKLVAPHLKAVPDTPAAP